MACLRAKDSQSLTRDDTKYHQISLYLRVKVCRNPRITSSGAFYEELTGEIALTLDQIQTNSRVGPKFRIDECTHSH
jgi:hypothetical protein